MVHKETAIQPITPTPVNETLVEPVSQVNETIL